LDILIIGWSDLVRRRVLPALDKMERIDLVHVATTGNVPELGNYTKKGGTVFSGQYAVKNSLEQQLATLAYVSGVNTDHAPRVLAALESECDVIVDKPAFLNGDDRRICIESATARHRLLAEATVWSWHSQVAGLKERLK